MKIFKWSLVPTKQIKKLEDDKSYIEEIICKLQCNCRDKNATYKKLFNGDSYMVVRVSELGTTPIAIKEFPFGDDMEYAKLCADELVEHLNEKI